MCSWVLSRLGGVDPPASRRSLRIAAVDLLGGASPLPIEGLPDDAVLRGGVSDRIWMLSCVGAVGPPVSDRLSRIAVVDLLGGVRPPKLRLGTVDPVGGAPFSLTPAAVPEFV